MEFDYEMSPILAPKPRDQRLNTHNFDAFSHRFFDEYHVSSCESTYDNDFPRNFSKDFKMPSSKSSLCSTSSESQILYQITPQGEGRNQYIPSIHRSDINYMIYFISYNMDPYIAWFWPMLKASSKSKDPSKRLQKLKLCRTLTNEYNNEHIIYIVQKRRNSSAV